MQVIIDTWQAQTTEQETALIIPDGCNDVILKRRKHRAPKWIISPLQGSSLDAMLEADTEMFGFRLQPGTQIQKSALLQQLHRVSYNEDDGAQLINNYCAQHAHITEALQTLKSREISVSSAAKELTLNQRGLQRLIKQETGKTPLFWIRLAKVRRAARAIIEGMPLGDCAFANGFADQAHMTREVKHWLGTTPSKLPEVASIKQQLKSRAYS